MVNQGYKRELARACGQYLERAATVENWISKTASVNKGVTAKDGTAELTFGSAHTDSPTRSDLFPTNEETGCDQFCRCPPTAGTYLHADR